MHIIQHFITITKHRHKVLKYCFQSGLYMQGLLHDLSKYSFVEFFRGAKYYTGVKSPIGIERKEQGYSVAWLHHKGRNKHHPEYWVDLNKEKNCYEPVEMPNRYIAESFCDHLAASKTYNKKQFEPQLLKRYFEKEILYVPMHQKTKEKLGYLIDLYLEKGEKEVFAYIKVNMRK